MSHRTTAREQVALIRRQAAAMTREEAERLRDRPPHATLWSAPEWYAARIVLGDPNVGRWLAGAIEYDETTHGGG